MWRPNILLKNQLVDEKVKEEIRKKLETDKTKLSGIGELQFLGLNQLPLSEDLSGYTLMFQATHGSDDYIPGEE